MTRKMVDVNIDLFRGLRKWLPPEYHGSSDDVQRYIETDDDEKDWLKSVSFDTDPDLVFNAQQQICVAAHGVEKFLLCIGFEPDFNSSEFIYEEVNSGLFCAAVVDLGLEPIIGEDTGYELVDTIFQPGDINISSRVAYKFTAVSRFFPALRLYRIPSGSPFLSLDAIVSRVGLFSLTRTDSLRPLSWSSAALETAREICTSDNEHFPINLVLHAMLERKWEHAFLDIYRCVEFLFPFPKANDLKRALQLNIPTSDVSYQIESILGWRQQEDVALNILFSKLQLDQLSRLLNALGLPVEQNSTIESCGKAVARCIYRLRNDCVHYRPAQSRSELKDQVDWPFLVQELLKAATFFHRSETSPQI